jgi:PAS domain S-box-containing protein
MPTASSENLRLAALDRCGILDTPPDPHFDRITRLAAQFFDAPMATISFVAHDRSWFKCTHGFQQIQLARSASFCSHTIGCPEALVIPDATADERFAGLAHVAGDPRVRFYAGVPVVTAEGFAVGAVAVMDTRPRGPLSESEICALRDFSALISRELNTRSSAGAASQNAVDPSILSTVLKLAQEAAGLGTWDWSVPSGSITRSEQCCRIYGLPAGQTTMSYAQWLSTVHPEDRDRVQAYHESLLREEGPSETEFRIIWPDGSVHWIVSKAKMCPDGAGEAARVIGVNLDVTHLREAEEARRESEQRYSDLFRTMSQAVTYFDGEGRVLRANPATEKLFGLSIEETRGRHRSELHLRAMSEDGTPISADEFPSLVALRTGSEVHDVVVRMWNARTEEPRWVSIDAIPRFREGETKPYEVQVTCQDLTARVEAAARLRASEERSRLLIEHGMEVIIVIDAAGTILYVSPSVERVFGYPLDLLIGTNTLEYVHPDDRQAIRGSLSNILHSPPSVAVTHVRLRHRDGEWRVAESRAANCLQVKGLRGIVVNLRDVTERHHYEEQLRISHDQQRQLAARVESAREEERARISREVHDEFGQMLSVLKLDFETLASQLRPRRTEARREFDKRVAGIVREIDLSMNTVRRIAAEMRPAVFEDLGLVAALNWQLQEFELRTGIRCRRRGLSRSAGLAAEPSLAVFRIFQEILTNVIRHAHATTLAVAVGTDRDWFTLRVSDNGKGFDSKLLSPSVSLGLLSMRERAGLHGGTVEWSGRRNGGTTVTVRLPREVNCAPAKT